MSVLSQRLKMLRKKNKLTQKDIAKYLNMSESGYGYYEQDRNEPSLETLTKLASKYNVSVSYLTGETDNPLPELTEKEERDIAKDLEDLLKDLENPKEGYAHFNGQSIKDVDESDRDLLIAAVETSMKIAKQIAKKKYNPNKNKK